MNSAHVKSLKYFALLTLFLFGFLFFIYIPSNTLAEDNKVIWSFKGKKQTSEKYQQIDPNSLQGRNTLRLTFNLKGYCFDEDDIAQIIFDQGEDWHSVDLMNYVKNCKRGKQTVDIPLSDFEGLDTTKPVGLFHARFWKGKNYEVDISQAMVFDSKDRSVKPIASPRSPSPSPSEIPSPTPTPLPLVSPSPSPSISPSPIPSASPVEAAQTGSWPIQSVSSMKVTKDVICNKPSQTFVENWVKKAKELGANYISVETPYEDPYCGDALSYTKLWIETIRNNGLKVWHRHMPLAFEGIYNAAKDKNQDYLKTISDYIKNNPLMFAPDDLFTPIPEPQNGGIFGVTYCALDVCQFNDAASFNKWLRDAVAASEEAFKFIGLENVVHIGYFGFDGFVAWGDNNPDWNGILEDATIAKMGNITVDHYPEAVGDTMENDLNELQKRYPNVPIVIGEWGTITGGDTKTQVQATMKAAKRPGVIGFNYWHLGMGGNEALINSDFTNLEQFSDVQSFFKPF